jgi:hypothetical protein
MRAKRKFHRILAGFRAKIENAGKTAEDALRFLLILSNSVD